MRRADAVIALIEDPAVIERVPSWLGLWESPPALSVRFLLPSGRPRLSPTIPCRTSPERAVDLFNRLNQMMGGLQKLGLNIEPEPQ